MSGKSRERSYRGSLRDGTVSLRSRESLDQEKNPRLLWRTASQREKVRERERREREREGERERENERERERERDRERERESEKERHTHQIIHSSWHLMAYLCHEGERKR